LAILLLKATNSVQKRFSAQKSVEFPWKNPTGYVLQMFSSEIALNKDFTATVNAAT